VWVFFYLVGFGFLWFKILEVSKLNRGIQFFGPNPIEKNAFFCPKSNEIFATKSIEKCHF
jgi:hypothetical protein